MELNVTSTIPLFEQLKKELKEKIKSGIYMPGQKIPTEAELSKIYGVSRITIRRAVEELSKEGILTKIQGKGTFVQEKRLSRKIEHTISFSDACIANHMIPGSHVNKREVFPPHSHPIQESGCFGNDSVVYIQRIRTADDVPIMCENNYYPYSTYSFLLTEPLDVPLYNLLKNKYNIEIGCSLHSHIDVLRASSNNAKLLKIAPGEPLFLLYTEMYDKHNNLIHVGEQYIVGSRYRFDYECI